MSKIKSTGRDETIVINNTSAPDTMYHVQVTPTTDGSITGTPNTINFSLYIICEHMSNCSDYPMMCGTCKHNKGKKSHYEPVDVPHMWPHYYTPNITPRVTCEPTINVTHSEPANIQYNNTRVVVSKAPTTPEPKD